MCTVTTPANNISIDDSNNNNGISEHKIVVNESK